MNRRVRWGRTTGRNASTLPDRHVQYSAALGPISVIRPRMNLAVVGEKDVGRVGYGASTDGVASHAFRYVTMAGANITKASGENSLRQARS